ncbi:hypothetical protein CS542_06645 [Pedobacter sp. IW39]|nr:hypothetical protein CS542_06645 [Pedobacter sp. IW39]
MQTWNLNLMILIKNKNVLVIIDITVTIRSRVGAFNDIHDDLQWDITIIYYDERTNLLYIIALIIAVFIKSLLKQ